VTPQVLYEIVEFLLENGVELPEDVVIEITLLSKEGKNNTRTMPCDTGRGCWCSLATNGDCPSHY